MWTVYIFMFVIPYFFVIMTINDVLKMLDFPVGIRILFFICTMLIYLAITIIVGIVKDTLKDLKDANKND